MSDFAILNFRYPDKEVGQYPVAYVVRKGGSKLSETEVIDFIGKLVSLYFKVWYYEFLWKRKTIVNKNDVVHTGGSIQENPKSDICIIHTQECFGQDFEERSY